MSSNKGKTIALVVAAGRGTRVAGAGLPKQYVPIQGNALIAHTLKPLLAHTRIDHVLVVRHVDDEALYAEAIAPVVSEAKLLAAAIGGTTRQESVRRGLEALEAFNPARVLIHDAARPFLSPSMLDALFAALDQSDGVLLASPMSDTVKRDNGAGHIAETVPRAKLWRAETPQAFNYAAIRAAHQRAATSGKTDFTDDASIAEWADIPVRLVDSGGGNSKITTAEDLAMAANRLGGAAPLDVRTGQGFDVHQFCAGDHVWLCGVKIPHTHGIEAHSDGDVGLHALTDALLGAIADSDIGVHFKNTDPRWRGASSDRFLADARARVEARGGVITNVDVTVLSEAPRIGPHREAMRKRMADILAIDVSRVSIKATTTETLGFVGRREGLAALATATIIMRG